MSIPAPWQESVEVLLYILLNVGSTVKKRVTQILTYKRENNWLVAFFVFIRSLWI